MVPLHPCSTSSNLFVLLSKGQDFELGLGPKGPNLTQNLTHWQQNKTKYSDSQHCTAHPYLSSVQVLPGRPVNISINTVRNQREGGDQNSSFEKITINDINIINKQTNQEEKKKEIVNKYLSSSSRVWYLTFYMHDLSWTPYVVNDMGKFGVKLKRS